ncbi:hypothetical protein DXF91_10575 [Enterobacter roggenkampii]|uniref:Uncharacterized protein n=1 Tax=Enterobacter roggenkampii TaxID=1812935 RepID=A0ABD7GZ64_9ENTR|nr:hypothetical protein DXF88_16130 [Enterobacter roggenkampii]RDT23109.1 hypothetical protein DXF91_10575 [Enterobacter roggenkampii]RDT39582.1 hypothetical protein DXF89_12400 [Enterobacter roggenkampii]RDT60273.1 hypothetical protein DXF87_08950 [Enterobacter roggenkampii]RTP18345.1 hypothetical protein EKN52_18895 [Enterobacter roggenkampii]
MNKRLTNRMWGKKKPPHHVGEDRDGVYGKENRVYWLLRVLLLLLKNEVSELRCIRATSRS